MEAEYSVRGMLGRGMIDFVIMYQHFSIVVVEVSWYGMILLLGASSCTC